MTRAMRIGLAAAVLAAGTAAAVAAAPRSVGSTSLHLTHLDLSNVTRVSGTTFSVPNPSLVAAVSKSAASATALRLVYGPPGGVRDAVLATVSRNGASCFCWVVDVTPSNMYVADTYGRASHTPLGSEAFDVVYVDARSGDVWYNQFYG